MLIRFFDISFSLIAFLLLSPLFLIVSIALKFSGEGEIFYLQPRIGKDAKIFYIIKFVTMLKNSASMSLGTITVKNDPRILSVGRILRKTKINELPQIINILKGDMSFIGPRPQTKDSFDMFSLKDQKIITTTMPGLSGIGSIIFRNEEELLNNASNAHLFYEHVIAPYKGSLERWYIENKTVYTYFLLIILTVWVVFLPKSKLPWKIFKLPRPSKALDNLLI
jgi:lipopolysaccharide/colanic/teichoic acid biosynthesis glycosyltransferase